MVPMDLFTFFLAVPDMDAMSLPSKRTAPSPGVSMPFKIRNSVVFPAPDGPITETNSPWGTVNVTWSRARVPFLNCFPTF